jgi:hypothetical protein
VQLISSRPFDPPIIDPRYGSNPVDLDVLLASIVYNRQVLATAPMKLLEPLQLNPRSNATDQEILEFIKANVQTEFHPSGTCAMLPLDLGGVVDPQLLVYGTQNLRVVDASIMPVIPASHLQAVVYGIAEKVSIANVVFVTHTDRRTGRRYDQERNFWSIAQRTAAGTTFCTDNNADYYTRSSAAARVSGVVYSVIFVIIASAASNTIVVDAMLLNIHNIVFARTAVDLVAALNGVVFLTATDFAPDSFVAARCDSITFARNNGILHPCISLLVYVFICLYMCIDLHMRSNYNTLIDQDDDYRVIVRVVNQVLFLAELEPSGSDFPISIDDDLSTYARGDDNENDNSFAGRDLYICTDDISDIKHKAVFCLVDSDHMSIISTLFSVIIHAVIAVDFCTLWIIFYKTLFEYKVFFEVLLEFFFQRLFHQVFGAFIVVESDDNIIICKSINALVVLILQFFWW